MQFYLRQQDSGLCHNVTQTRNKAVLISASIALSQTPAYTARPGASASHSVPAYVSAIAGTYCAYPRRHGQAELTCAKI